MPRIHAPSCACAAHSASGAEQTIDELTWLRSLHGLASSASADAVAAALATPRGAAAVDAADCAGYRPLHYAARRGDEAIVAALLSSPATNINARTEGGQATPLMRAAAGGHGGVVAVLLSAGAEVGAVDGDGQTAAHKAAAAVRVGWREESEREEERKGGPRCVCVCACVSNRPTPFPHTQGHPEILRALLAACPDSANVCDRRGKTPAECGGGG